MLWNTKQASFVALVGLHEHFHDTHKIISMVGLQPYTCMYMSEMFKLKVKVGRILYSCPYQWIRVAF